MIRFTSGLIIFNVIKYGRFKNPPELTSVWTVCSGPDGFDITCVKYCNMEPQDSLKKHSYVCGRHFGIQTMCFFLVGMFVYTFGRLWVFMMILNESLSGDDCELLEKMCSNAASVPSRRTWQNYDASNRHSVMTIYILSPK